MPDLAATNLQDVLLTLVPADGSAIGNISLRSLASDKLDRDMDEAGDAVARDALVAAGTLVKGAGRGGSFRLASAADAPAPSEAATAQVRVSALTVSGTLP